MELGEARELDREDLFFWPAFPATPHPIVGQDMLQRTVVQHVPPMGGMSLLDYFAAAALSGLLAHPDMEWDPDLPADPPPFDFSEPWRIAKATLNARPATPKPPKAEKLIKP